MKRFFCALTICVLLAFDQEAAIIYYDKLEYEVIAGTQSVELVGTATTDLDEVVRVPTNVYDDSGRRYPVSSIGDGALENVQGPRTLIIDEGLTRIGRRALRGASFSRVQLPASAAIIGDSALAALPLTSIVIPSGVTTLGQGVMAHCPQLQWVEVPGTVKVLPDQAFIDCGALRWVLLRSGVERIGQEAFARTGLCVAQIPDGVVGIEARAYQGCGSMTTVILAGTVASVASGAFPSTVTQVFVLGDEPASVASDAFPAANATLFVPAGNSRYGTAAVWKNFAHIVENTMQLVSFDIDELWADQLLPPDVSAGCGAYHAWCDMQANKPSFTADNYCFNMTDTIKAIENASVSGTVYDVAMVKLGEDWRTPTREELRDLSGGCDWTPATHNGVAGWTVSKSGKSLFVPAAGYYDGTQCLGKGTDAWLWSSTPAGHARAYALHVTSTTRRLEVCDAHLGMSLLPVGGEKPNPVGDVNGDGVVNIADANVIIRLILNGTAGITAEALKSADVNGDGVVNIADANAVILAILND